MILDLNHTTSTYFTQISIIILIDFFQNYSGRLRTICGVNVAGQLIEKDMSEKIGEFSPLQLVYFQNITTLDISGYTDFKSQLFMETVKGCSQLKEFRLTGCVQFHEHQLVKMFCQLKLLEIVDASHCSMLQYISAHRIITGLRNLRMINLEPKYPYSENKKWELMVVEYYKINFGHSVMNILPSRVRSARLAKESDESE